MRRETQEDLRPSLSEPRATACIGSTQSRPSPLIEENQLQGTNLSSLNHFSQSKHLMIYAQMVSESHADAPIPTGAIEHAIDHAGTSLRGISQSGVGGCK